MVVCTSFLCQCIVYGLCFYTNCSPDQKSKRCLSQTMSDQPYMNNLIHSIDSCNHTYIHRHRQSSTHNHIHTPADTHSYRHSQPYTHTKTHAHVYTYPHLHSALWIYVHSCTHTPTSHINCLIHICMHTYTLSTSTHTPSPFCVDTNKPGKNPVDD